ncbi:hypothetical protein D3C71_2019880 [compost metagenome]
MTSHAVPSAGMGLINGSAAISTNQPIKTYRPVDHRVDVFRASAFITKPAAAAPHTSVKIAVFCADSGWPSVKVV